MRPVVRKTRKIQLGLDIDLHALVLQFLLHRPLHRSLHSARSLPLIKFDLFAFALVFFPCSSCARKWQACLRIVRPRSSAAHAICFQAPRHFTAPFRLSRTGKGGFVVRVVRAMKAFWRGHTYSYGL